MSFFRRNKDSPQIPLPAGRDTSQPNVLRRPDPSPPPPSYRSSGPSDPYEAPQINRSYSPQPGESTRGGRGVGDPYSRAGAGSADADRNALFGGYNPERSAGRNRFDDRLSPAPGGGYGGGPRPGQQGSGRWQDRSPQNQEEEDEDVEAIKQDTRNLRNESKNSTANSLRLLAEAEETGNATLMKLGDQSGKIANIQRHLDASKGNASRAQERAEEIRQLNKSIFNPVVTFSKEKRRLKEEANETRRRAEQEEEREKSMMFARQNAGRGTYGYGDDEDSKWGPSGMRSGGGSGRFQSQQDDEDSGAEDDRVINGRLDEMLAASGRIRGIANQMNSVLDSQMKQLDATHTKVDNTDREISGATRRLKKL